MSEQEGIFGYWSLIRRIWRWFLRQITGFSVTEWKVNSKEKKEE